MSCNSSSRSPYSAPGFYVVVDKMGTCAIHGWHAVLSESSLKVNMLKKRRQKVEMLKIGRGRRLYNLEKLGIPPINSLKDFHIMN